MQPSCGNSCPHCEQLLNMYMHMMPHSSWTKVSDHKCWNHQQLSDVQKLA
jgi:hypothetical protein